MASSTKKVIVNQDTCIGCNSCCIIDPETFELDTTEYKAKVIKQPQGDISENTKTAISACPVGAISIVDDN